MKKRDLINDSLERLDHLGGCPASLKDRINTLKIELRFLRTFIMSRKLLRDDTYYNMIGDKYWEIEFAIRKDVVPVIFSLGVGEVVRVDLDRRLSSVQEKIEVLKLQVHECYCQAEQSSPRVVINRDQVGVVCIDYVLENMKDLIQSKVISIIGVNKLINTMERRLMFLRNALRFVAKFYVWGTPDELDFEDEFVYAATMAASYIFSCWIDKMDENRDLFLVRYKPNGEEDTSLYRCVLQASGSITSDPTDLLVGFIDFLLEHLLDLLNRDGSLGIPSKDYFKSLRGDLKLVRSLLATTNASPDYMKSLRQHLGAKLNKVVHLLKAGNVRDMSDEMMSMDNTILLHSLGRRKLLTVLCLEDLVNDELTSTAPMEDQLEILCEDLRLLRTFYIETQNNAHVHQEIKDVQSLMEDMAHEAGTVMYSFHVNEDKEGMAKEMNRLLPDLLEKIKLIKADMKKICFGAASSNSQETCGQRGTTISLKDLTKQINSFAARISSSIKPRIAKAVKDWIENLQYELKFLVHFLENSEEQFIESEDQKALEMSITNMANKAKFVIEPTALNNDPEWYRLLKFSTVMEEVELIKKDVKIIYQKIAGESAMQEVVVGFQDEAENITEQLIGGSEQLNIISIIGTGGLGKTTLTKKLYSNPFIVAHFDVRAWCCISQHFQEMQVLLDILDQVVELTEGTYQGTNADLKVMLRKCLKGRRYLIIIDDIWDIKAWTALRRCFDDDCNGSRIVFTTRLQEIASNVQPRSIPYHLRFFTDAESFELLQQKLFSIGRCPKEQVNKLNQIAKNCKGLPFAVVLMAGVLARKKKEEWEKVAESLSQLAGGDMEHLSMRVPELSYNNLPDHLRPCFLYLGGFPEDREISAKKLMRLWVAEGFIQKADQKSSEDVANDWLMDLIGRSLVIVAKRGSGGGVKTLRVHDLLRSFSLSKAKKEKFLLLLDENDEPFTPIDLKFHHPEDVYVESYNSNSITYKQYRLCIYSVLNKIKKLSSSLNVCSLLHFAPFPSDMTSPNDLSLIFTNFKLLNVLDLGKLLLKDLTCGIELLVQLRLLTVQIRSTSIPPSIANLKKLETFLVKGKGGEIHIPDTVWSMESLRHLHVDKRASSIWDNRKDATLNKLQTLSTPTLPQARNSRDVMRSMPNLQKLKCIVTASRSSFENCYSFPELDSLSQLESLKVIYYASEVRHGRLNFPPNLKKLTLSHFRLPWSDIATIATLPNLEVLKLVFKAFDGKEWETRDADFLKLKYLKLEALNIEQWNVSSEDHFPLLKKLVVHRCKKLEKIPSTIGDIDTLEMIEVKWCIPSAAKSAKDIEKEQKENGKVLEVIAHS